MEEKLLESFIKSFTEFFIEKSKKTIGKLVDNVKQFIGNDLKTYLTKQTDKYSHIKTLLNGNTPVYLYDFYFPMKIDRDCKAINTDSVKKLFSSTHYITIIGNAGSGKSTLIKHLFINSIYEKFRIPIVIELRYLNESDENLELYIKDTISKTKIAVNEDILNRMLENGEFVLFFDGFDEVKEKNKQNLTKQINDFVDKYNDNYYIITSRPYSNIEYLPLFTNHRMKGLEMEEINKFIYKQFPKNNLLAKEAIKSIEKGNTIYIENFLENPLLLSLYLLTFQSNAAIPKKKYIFYRRVIDTLFSEHDSKTKVGYIRDKMSGLNQEVFEIVLKTFGFLSYFEDVFSFDKDYVNDRLKKIKEKNQLDFDNDTFIKDLLSSISLWVKDEEYSFTHRSLQEYFTALFIKDLKEERKTIIYKKIIEKYSSEYLYTYRDVNNLLEFLKDMDEYYFIKYFYYPQLLDIKTNISSIGNRSTENYLRFFIEGIGKYRHKDHIYYSSMKKFYIDKTAYISIPFFYKLSSYLDDIINSENTILKYENLLISTKSGEESFSIIDILGFITFNDEQFLEFHNLLDKSKLEELSEDFYGYIDKEISYCKNLISNTDDIEKDIVNFI